MHILLVHDATAAADHAAQLLEQLAPRLGARVTVLETSRRQRLTRRAGRVPHDPDRALRSQDVPTEVQQVAGRPVPSIVARLERGDIDLVVLGGGGRRGVLTRLQGSTATKVLRASPVPVLIVGDAPLALRRILVCTTLEMPHGTAALEIVVQIASATSAEVEILHVLSQLPRLDGPTEAASPRSRRPDRALDAAEAQHVDEVVDVFTEHGVTARGRIRHGLVVDEIVDRARRLPADLVVLGAHDRPGLVPRLLANITKQVVDELARPVLVVREPSGRQT